MSIRLPRLLTALGDERARLHPIRLRLELRMSRLSTAEMTLPDSDPAVAVRDLVHLYDESGSVGIFRVVSIDTEAGLTRTISLEHALCTLSDALVPAMTMNHPVRTALYSLLAHQTPTYWQLGDVDVPEGTTVVFSTGHENLLTALMRLISLLPGDIIPVFDQTALPWTLHLRRPDDSDACEGRIQRNLCGIRVNTDSSDLCTRVYPYGAGEGMARINLRPLTGTEYLDSPATSTWGIISRSFTSNSIFDASTLRAVAEKYLARHSVPTVSVEAEAIDLSHATGEGIDSFRLGRLCRLIWHEAGITLQERIIAMTKPDVFGKPGQVTLTLCNHIHDVADEIADMLREVTADRTLGGALRDVATSNRAAGTTASGIAHYFRVEKGPTVLGAVAQLDPDEGVTIGSIQVDGADVPLDTLHDDRFDLMPYLNRAESGSVLAGRHALSIFPVEGAVNSTVTLQLIDSI